MQDKLDEKLKDRDGERRRLLDSFAYFCKESWGWVDTIKLRWNWHHDLLCSYLQALREGKIEIGPELEDILEFCDLIVNVPPGTSKSVFCSILWPAWCRAHDPTEKIMAVSYSDDIVCRQSIKERELITSDWYQAFFDNVQISKKVNQVGYWETTAGGWRFSGTRRKTATGLHPSIIIYDDILSVSDGKNDKERLAANDWHSKTMASRGAAKDIGRRRLNVQQRLHEMDMSGYLESHGEWFVFCLPMEYEADRMKDIGLGVDPRKERGELLWSDMYPASRVAGFKRDLGEDYYGQHQQRPAAAGGNIFKIDRINQIDYDEVPFSKITRFKRAVDKAATQNGGCFTAAPFAGIVELENNHIQVYFIEMLRGQWSIDIVEENIKLYTKMDESRFGRERCETVVEEEGGSAGKQAAFDTMRNMRGLRVRVIPTGGKSKQVRWQPLANAVYRYEIYVVTTKDGKPVDEMLYLLQELQSQPKSQYKDATDAASLAYNELIQPGVFDLPDPYSERDDELESRDPCNNNLCDRLARSTSPFCCDCCKVIFATNQDIRVVHDAHGSECNYRHGNLSRSGEWQPNGQI